jgi:NTE family protein
MNLIDSPLFAGLSPSALNDILGRMAARSYTTNQYICREGDTSDRMYLLESGLVEVIIGEGPAAQVIAHLRRGDIFGEMGLLSDEPRAASILTVMPTLVLELSRSAFAEIIHLHPAILLNISRVLIERQKKSLRRSLAHSRRGEFILLMIGRGTESLAQQIIAICQNICPLGVTVVDLSEGLSLDKILLADKTVDSAMALLENLVDTAAPTISVAYCDHPDLASLIRYVDRVALLGTEAEIGKASESSASFKNAIDVFLMSVLTKNLGDLGNFRVMRVLGSDEDRSDSGWIARHLTRTKLGLALGAGGAKGFAHVGVLGVLRRAGYVVDFLAGSSIGALIGSLLGLGLNVDDIEVQLKRIWAPEHVDLLADLSPEGISVGLERILRTIKDIVGDRMMSDLCLPLRILTADLQEGEAVPLDNWPVYEAIRAALSIPGLALPYMHGPQRLVDAVCLTPVPTSFVRDMGADIVMSVNLLSRQTLTAWPSEGPPMPAHKRKRTQTMDPVVETLMMLQIDTSIRNASQADIILTPRFPPSSWRDFSLAELFREAGREVAEAELVHLLEASRPTARMN